ncbi:MAG: ABC transporter permease [Chloroflexi bacterium]|nr:ABC transporter permease [Chloroflexota bacterium]
MNSPAANNSESAVARALIHNPSLILADEPIGNLDSKTGEEVMTLLKQLNKEQAITLIVVTHDAEVAAYADRIVHLRDGAVENITVNSEQFTVDSEQFTVGSGHAAEGAALIPDPSTKPGEVLQSPNSPPLPISRLSFSDIIRSALRNLGRRPVRNMLTAGGVLIGIITLVAMVSFGVGVQKEVQRNFESVGLENIFVSAIYEEPTEGFDPFAEREPKQVLSPGGGGSVEANTTGFVGQPGIETAAGYRNNAQSGRTIAACVCFLRHG